MSQMNALAALQRRIAALEQQVAQGPVRPAEASRAAAPPPMSHMAQQPRTTQLVGTEQQRAIANRRAARAALMAQHNRSSRFFSAPQDPTDARIPRASMTGPVV